MGTDKLFKFGQGDLLRDNITEFEGTVVGRTDFYNGCVQYFLEPKSVDGKKPEGAWVDESQLSLVKKAKVERETLAPAERKGGGFRPTPRV